jgi:hypothetical protein
LSRTFAVLAYVFALVTIMSESEQQEQAQQMWREDVSMVNFCLCSLKQVMLEKNLSPSNEGDVAAATGGVNPTLLSLFPIFTIFAPILSFQHSQKTSPSELC